MYLQLIFLFLFFIAFLEIFTKFGRNKFKVKVLFSFVMTVFFLLAVLRWERGTDWGNYYKFFNQQEVFGEEAFEYGFTILNAIVKSLFDSYTVLLIIQGYIYYKLMTKVILKVSVYPLLSLLVLFVVGSSAGIFFVRQTVAIAITTYSFLYIKERNIYKFVLCIFFAVMFHSSSFIFIIAYYIYKLRLSNKKILICLSLVFIVGYLISKLAEQYTALSWVVTAKLGNYIVEGVNTDIAGMSSSLLYLRGVSGRVFSFLFIFVFVNSFRKTSSECNGLFNIYLAGILIYMLAGSLNITLARLANCFDIFQIFLFGYVFQVSKNLRTRFIAFAFLTSFLFARLVAKNPYEDLFIPYKSVFNKELPVEIG